MDRNSIIRLEAEKWRAEGRITAAFHAWVQTRYQGRAPPESARAIQRVLIVVASLLVLIAVVTLVSEFWQNFSRLEKFWLMVFFSVFAGLLGVGFHFVRPLRLLTHVLLPLVLPLYLFGMTYGDFSSHGQPYGTSLEGRAAFTLPEALVVLAGVALAVGALAAGLRTFPTLAFAAPPSLLGALAFVFDYAPLGDARERAWLWTLLGVVFMLHAILLILWLGKVTRTRWKNPAGLRLALATNVPWGWVLIVLLVGEYGEYRYPGGEPFDVSLVSVTLSGVYAAALLALGVRFALPEQTAMAGAFLIADAVWIGADKGGLIGTVLAILAVAVALILLATSGVLRRVLKAKPPSSPAPPLTRRGDAPPARVRPRDRGPNGSPRTPRLK